MEGRNPLKKYIVEIDDAAAAFYEKAGEKTKTEPEKIMAEALFDFAAELSLKAVIFNRKPKK